MDVNNKTRHQANKIINYKSYSTKKKIDSLLFLDADQYCNLGKDSLKHEKQSAEYNSRYIYRLIKTIDKNLGKLLLKNREE